MANAVKIILMCILLNLLMAFATSMSQSATDPTVQVTTWISSEHGSLVTTQAASGATEAELCFRNGTGSCVKQNQNAMANLVDVWSASLNVLSTIAALFSFASLGMIPVKTFGIILGAIASSENQITQVMGTTILLVFSTMNLVMWITIIKVARTGQWN